MRATNRRWAIICGVVLGLLAVVPVTSALTKDSASAAAALPGDGKTSATAGASCWGIKQAYPASTTGTYWLLNSKQARPTEFTCDMTTAGGGWVLVGRGLNGWTFAPEGQGSPASLRTDPNGSSPAALSSDAITQILDGTAVSDLADGIRIERTISGASQDFRMYPKYRNWSWSFPAGQLLNKAVVNGTTYNGSNTKDTANSTYGQTTNGLSGVTDGRRLVTTINTGFGTGTSGVVPTKVWLRPQTANSAAGFSPIPAGGYPVQATAPTLKNRSEQANWGVVGINHTNEESINPWSNTVNVIKTYGDKTFVGGRFTHVQQGAGGAQTAQASFAAFDLNGNWISSIRPVFAGRVWDMTMTDDGKLIVGGDFTSVNGLPDTAGMVALNPATGAVITTWKASVSRPSGGKAIVRALDARGPWVYAAGRFTKLKGGSWNEITVSSARSVKASDGTPGTWAPIVNASTVRLRVSADATRVYMGGYFNAVNGDTNHGYYAITSPATGAVVPGMGPYQPSIGSTAKFQQAVSEYNGFPLVGGSEHTFQKYNRNRTQLIDSHITRNGGDFQSIEVEGDYVYAACHCANWVYQGTNNWSNPNGFRSIDPIRLVGRWNAETFEYDTSWYPGALLGQVTEGVWTTDVDVNQCLWVGGDLVRGSYSGVAARDWLGGFARFCPEDSTPPSTPSNFTAKSVSGSVQLSWGASSDASGTVLYDVYRNDRVIATVYGTSFTDTVENGAKGTLSYTVRASDARDNRSASPAPINVAGPATTISTPVPYGATWKYLDNGSDQGTAWRAAGFADGSWASGKAVLGWGGTQATVVGGTLKPITTYFRTSFDLADASQVKLLDLKAKFTQGAVVYVNGVEVGRSNMPAGAITSSTVASAWVGGSTDLAEKPFTVPGTLLKNGTNTIAVEVHGWRNQSGKVFLDLQASTRGASGDTTAPSKPVLTGSSSHANAVDLSWTPATDNVALGGYVIRRDGTPLAVAGATQTTFTDDVDTSVAHEYTVTAFDTTGNTNASAAVTIAPPDPAADPNLLAFNSTWKFFYQDASPVGAWAGDGYDDATWASGPGEFGFGDTPKGTVITQAPSPRPLTSYYRTSVTVTDPTKFQAIALDLIRNSGAVVYVNGVEVARSNMPAGVITKDTYASSAVPTAQRKVPVRIEVPTSAFRAGANTIAVELHLGGRTQATGGFDLKITGLP